MVKSLYLAILVEMALNITTFMMDLCCWIPITGLKPVTKEGGIEKHNSVSNPFQVGFSTTWHEVRELLLFPA